MVVRSSDVAALDRRRALLCAAASLAFSPASEPARAFGELPSRLDAVRLIPPSRSEPGALRYPSWLAGAWHVTCRNAAFSTPLGSRFVDQTLIEEIARTQDAAVRWRARYVEAPSVAGWPKLTVAQDRLLNAAEEERAFIPSTFRVQGGRYEFDAAHPHGRVLLNVLDTDVAAGTQSAQTRAYDVKMQFQFQTEIDILLAGWEETDSSFVTSELTAQRQLLPSRAVGGASEVVDTSFLELLTRFERPASERPQSVRARYRVVQYLGLPGVAPPAASASRAARALEMQAAGQAVSILDYDLLMERVEDATPPGRNTR